MEKVAISKQTLKKRGSTKKFVFLNRQVNKCLGSYTIKNYILVK